jgi:hypothetical protein
MADQGQYHTTNYYPKWEIPGSGTHSYNMSIGQNSPMGSTRSLMVVSVDAAQLQAFQNAQNGYLINTLDGAQTVSNIIEVTYSQ